MIKLEDISVIYDKKVLAVNNINLSINRGEFLGIIGSSGSGKSSLVKTINLLVKPSKGNIFVDGKNITHLNPKELRSVRREIGLIFQDYNLVDRSTVLDNVLTGRLGYMSSFNSLFGLFGDEDYEKASTALRQVGLREKMFVRGDQLSGGQKQRVAIARTLCQNPKIILADEPVSSLDISTAEIVMDYFKKINEKKGITIVINLHDVNLAKKYCSRIIALKEGKIIFDGKAGDVDDRVLKEIYHQK